MTVRLMKYHLLPVFLLLLAFFPEVLSRARKIPSADDALFLTPYIEKGRIDEAQRLATVPPLMDGVHSFSGFLTVNKTANSNLFFWLFKCQEGDWLEQPLVVWLQGGPGASSMYGLFTELGPFSVTQDQRLERREFAWNRKYNLVFIDNPVGAGFSFTDFNSGYARNETDVADDLYEAFIQLYKLFPSLQRNKFFITGESYAGKFIPAVAFKIYETNKISSFKIHIDGLMIGNPFSDPVNQVRYSSYMYKLGFVDKQTEDKLVEDEEEIRTEIRLGRWRSAFRDRNNELDYIQSKTGLSNNYDFVHDDILSIISDWKYLVDRDSTRRAIHVGDYPFNDGVTAKEYLEDDRMKSVKPWIEKLLTVEEFPILFYSGQFDIIVAYSLSVDFYMSLNWPRANEYRTANRCQFRVDGDVAGYYKTAGTFTEVMVRNTGHLVPIKQPRWAYELLDRFITDISAFQCESLDEP